MPGWALIFASFKSSIMLPDLARRMPFAKFPPEFTRLGPDSLSQVADTVSLSLIASETYPETQQTTRIIL